jgi:hypothetical protein
MNCIVCKKSLEDILAREGENQPNDGLAFHSYGHYGTTAFDPMDGTYLEVNICDSCIVQAGKDGAVLMGYPAAKVSGPMVKWPLSDVTNGER